MSHGLRERRAQLADEIVHGLHAHREAHEAIRNAQLRTHGRRQRGVRHETRVLDEAFHAPQALRQRKQMTVLEKALGFRNPAAKLAL